MLFHVELAKARSRVRDNRYVTNQKVGAIASAAQELVQTPTTLNFIAPFRRCRWRMLAG
jgi:hypothetical protein